jgi:enoyl-CoA hydratase/carnithine racemase
VASDVTHVTDLAELTDVAAGVAVSRDERDGRIATVTLTRPDRRNAMTPSMWRGLARIGEKLPADIRVVVVKGEGPSFCAGIDLRAFTAEGVPGEPAEVGPDDPGFDKQVAGYQDGYNWLRRSQFVSIAAVQGHAIGAGFQLALACDLRVLADNATLCMKEAALGLVPDLTGTKPLVEIVGLPRAIELCLTARTVDAQEAERLRLAERVVPLAALDETVGALAAQLLTTEAAAARETKALLTGAYGNSLPEQAAAERAAQARLLLARHPEAG